jgi:hypothetical protein
MKQTPQFGCRRALEFAIAAAAVPLVLIYAAATVAKLSVGATSGANATMRRAVSNWTGFPRKAA